MKPLKTSPFIPEFKRKYSNEILPVQWVSNDSNVRRKLSTSGCGHFLRCLGICARAISESVKRTPRQGGHIVQARLHATPARRQLLGDAALARRMLVLDCAQGHSQFRSAHLLVQFHRACGAAAGGQKEGASCNLKARSSLPSTGDAIFSAARAAESLLSLLVGSVGSARPMAARDVQESVFATCHLRSRIIPIQRSVSRHPPSFLSNAAGASGGCCSWPPSPSQRASHQALPCRRGVRELAGT